MSDRTFNRVFFAACMILAACNVGLIAYVAICF